MLTISSGMIGVITSESGAVFQDILHRLRDRYPCRVILWPVQVQGDRCVEQITSAIKGFNLLLEHGDSLTPNLIIIARGGGSVEDLWHFNDEIIIRAVFNSMIPIISAIGHETDTTLLDLVADLRAPTPTAAAEIAVPEKVELQKKIYEIGKRLNSLTEGIISIKKARVDSLEKSIKNIRYVIGEDSQRFDLLAIQLSGILKTSFQKKQAALITLNVSLFNFNFLKKEISKRLDEIQDFSDRLDQIIIKLIAERRKTVGTLSRLQESLSYRRTLRRGYAIVRDKDHNLLERSSDIAAKQILQIEFYDGLANVLYSGSTSDKEE